MFESLKKLWNKDPLLTEKPIVVKTNISEPVISFVNALKKDPKRFTIKKEFDEILLLPYGQGTAYRYSVLDKSAKKSFTCTVREVREFCYTDIEVGYENKRYVRTKPEPWLTDEEVLYVVKELEDFFKEKVERVRGKVEKRARERLTKLYKGE